MRLARFMAAALVFFVAGCTETGTDSYFETGAGLALHTPETPKATKDLQDYYRALCVQANPFGVPETTQNYNCGTLNVLVRTGFNDIDLRCDRYLAWIDRKRIEASTFKSGLSATNTLLTGVITDSADTLRYVAQAFGFATSIYDAYNNALLMGIEGSTIKKLVYERRRAYRSEFTKVNYSNYADATYALRGYLRICTPQTIMLSANDYALAGLSGNSVPTPAEIAKRDREVLQLEPVKPQAPANKVPPRPEPEKCPSCDLVFADPYDKAREPRHVEVVQERLCVATISAKPSSTALAKLRAYDNLADSTVTNDGLITNRPEYSALEENGCKQSERASAGYRSVYEKQKFRDETQIAGVVSRINKYLTKIEEPTIPANAKITSDEFRTAVASIRAKLGAKISDPFLTDKAEYTFGLDKALTENLLES